MMASLSMFALLLLASTVAGAAPEKRDIEQITMAVGDVQVLQSQNYPQNYPTDVRTQWEYTCGTEAETELLFECPVFELEPSTDCVWDRLIVTSRGRRDIKCGCDSPNTVTATGWMRLTFFSNAMNVGQGFDCTITCQDKVTATTCGTHTLASGEQFAIESTNYPEPYVGRERCQWEFVCPEETDHTLTISCPSFELASSTDCKNNRLIVASRGSRDVKCGTDSPDGTVTATGWARFTYFSHANTVTPGFRCYVQCNAV